MNLQLSPSAQKVQSALLQVGENLQVVELSSSTRTAQDAANSIGCQVGQIAKSLVFRGSKSSRSILVIASGSNRVDEHKISELLGEPIGKADVDFLFASIRDLRLGEFLPSGTP